MADFVDLSVVDGIATVTLHRGKVNALNEPMVEEIKTVFADIRKSERVRAIVLTGKGKFFSFGFDIPEFLSYSKDEFTRYLTQFADLYAYLFLFPKPVIAALNGHTIAGGCMLATACDYRLMVSGKAKISLNEISFGSSVFAGSVEMLTFCAGSKNAQTILYNGSMYSAEEAQAVGLVDQISTEQDLAEESLTVARQLGKKDGKAFQSIKQLLRQPVADSMNRREGESIRQFVDIWYSEETWKTLQEIKINS